MPGRIPTIRIWTISEKRTFALTAFGWNEFRHWSNQNFATADMDSGCFIYGRDEMIGWHRQLCEDGEDASIFHAIVHAIKILLDRISSRRCPTDVYFQIGKTLERLATSEQTANCFAELVWAAEGDLAENEVARSH